MAFDTKLEIILQQISEIKDQLLAYYNDRLVLLKKAVIASAANLNKQQRKDEIESFRFNGTMSKDMMDSINNYLIAHGGFTWLQKDAKQIVDSYRYMGLGKSVEDAIESFEKDNAHFKGEYSKQLWDFYCDIIRRLETYI